MTLMVSVSGVRGIVGESLTPQVALEFAEAFGTLLGGGRVVLARDTRPSGQMFAEAVAAGLLATGCRVTRLGVAMTPTAGHAIRIGGFDGGVVITASHNPSEWNGIKFLDNQGLAPDPAFARKLRETRDQHAFRRVNRGFQAMLTDDEAGERHADAVIAAVEVDLSPLKGTKIVLDSVNGAGCLVSPGLLASLGCEVLHVNGEPTGEFAHAPEPTADNLLGLGEVVRRANAAVGFAQDPDADRLALIDETGRYIGEEYTLALAAWSVLSRRPGKVAANLSTSRLVDAVAARFNSSVVRTPVGEANVARGMMANGCVIAGEGNGGVIDPRISPVRDSIAGMSLVLQLMAATGKTISQLVAELPQYAMIKQKFECPPDKVAPAVEQVAAAFAGEKVDRSDGVRIDTKAGWVQLRGSNTEPIIRVIAEADDEAAANDLIQRARSAAGL